MNLSTVNKLFLCHLKWSNKLVDSGNWRKCPRTYYFKISWNPVRQSSLNSCPKLKTHARAFPISYLGNQNWWIYQICWNNNINCSKSKEIGFQGMKPRLVTASEILKSKSEDFQFKLSIIGIRRLRKIFLTV